MAVVITYDPPVRVPRCWDSEADFVWNVDPWDSHLPERQDMKVTEDVAIVDAIGKTQEKTFPHSFSLTDFVEKDASTALFEDLNVIDKYDDAVSFIRNYPETFNFVDSHPLKFVEKREGLSEKVNFAEYLDWPVDAVISDLFWQKGVWTEESLANFIANEGRHAGYTPFRTFNTGDYTYDRALFRVAVDSETTDRVLLTNFDVAVDVDDIFDRGSATVTDKNFGVTVTFNRVFHIIPEILVSMRTGSSSQRITPVVITDGLSEADRKKKFKVMLYDDEGNPQTGSFVWTATGY